MSAAEFGGSLDGCYICQPDNPNADEEGCRQCDTDYWLAVLDREDRR